MEKQYWAHETAIVDEGAVVGAGTKIWHWAHVCGKNVKIGERCNLGQNVYVGNDVLIGDGVKIQNNVSVYDRVTLEDDVFCGPSMVFTNVINPRSHVVRKDEYQETLVRKGATLGANCTIVCGKEIGRYSFVAAGSVVTKSTQDFSLVMGNPARRVGWMCQCGVRLEAPESESAEVTCQACGARYLCSSEECSEIAE